MQKYVLLLIALIVTAFLAGCGTDRATSESTSGITTVPMAATEFTGKTLFMKSASINSSDKDFQLESNNNVTVGGVKTGTWLVSAAGNIEIRDLTDNLTATFTCIQREAKYFLVFNTASNQISRLYLDQADATGFDPSLMGGAKQGPGLNLTTPETITVSAFAGSPTGAVGSADGTGPAALFNRPMDITSDGTDFYVADYEKHLIRKISAAGEVTTIAGTGSAGQADNPVGTSASFNHPSGITCAGNFLYVVDSDNHAIRKIDKGSFAVTTIAGFLGAAGSADNPTGTSAGFNTPIGITTDGTNLYVADSGNHTIRKIVISTTAVTTIAGNLAGVGTVDGTSTSARFNLPSRLTTDGSNLYVADFNNRTIRKIVIATGVVSTLAGTAGDPPGSLEGTGPAARFYHIGGITTDGTNLYITEYNDTIESDPKWISLVRKVVIDGGAVTRLAGGTVTKFVPTAAEVTGSAGDVTGAAARFVTPLGITSNGSELYLTDNGFNNIRSLK